MTGERAASSPARWELAVMVWVSLLPATFVMNLLVLPLFPGIPEPVGVTVSSVVSVAFVVWVGLPVMLRLRTAVARRRSAHR